jgi:hypothetical protein
LLKLIVPVTILLTNYHLQKHTLKRESARGSQMGDGGDEEPNDNRQADRF